MGEGAPSRNPGVERRALERSLPRPTPSWVEQVADGNLPPGLRNWRAGAGMCSRPTPTCLWIPSAPPSPPHTPVLCAFISMLMILAAVGTRHAASIPQDLIVCQRYTGSHSPATLAFFMSTQRSTASGSRSLRIMRLPLVLTWEEGGRGGGSEGKNTHWCSPGREEGGEGGQSR